MLYMQGNSKTLPCLENHCTHALHRHKTYNPLPHSLSTLHYGTSYHISSVGSSSVAVPTAWRAPHSLHPTLAAPTDVTTTLQGQEEIGLSTHKTHVFSLDLTMIAIDPQGDCLHAALESSTPHWCLCSSADTCTKASGTWTYIIRMYSHLAEWVWNVNIEKCTCLSQKQIPPSDILSDANMQLRTYIGVDDS